MKLAALLVMTLAAACTDPGEAISPDAGVAPTFEWYGELEIATASCMTPSGGVCRIRLVDLPEVGVGRAGPTMEWRAPGHSGDVVHRARLDGACVVVDAPIGGGLTLAPYRFCPSGNRLVGTIGANVGTADQCGCGVSLRRLGQP